MKRNGFTAFVFFALRTALILAFFGGRLPSFCEYVSDAGERRNAFGTAYRASEGSILLAGITALSLVTDILGDGVLISILIRILLEDIFAVVNGLALAPTRSDDRGCCHSCESDVDGDLMGC
jgi:hypothetical protein